MGKIKIGISGAHSTGKSTFIKKIIAELSKKNSLKVSVVSDLASVCPLPILRKHTIESSLWIATTGLAQEIEAEYKNDIVIADRPILDSWAYFNAACKGKYDESNPQMILFKSLISNWLPTYDLIFQTEVNEAIQIEDNKGRDLDEDYRKSVAQEFVEANRIFKVEFRPLTVENRDTEYEFLLDQIYQRASS